MPDNKHLDLSGRTTIEAELDKGSNFTHIALVLDKDPSTISKEVRSRLSIETIGGYRMKYNACANRFKCQKSRVCHPCKATRNYKLCKRCGLCNAFCKDFIPYDCPRVKKPPYVCNGCSSKPECTLKKQLYRAELAHADYLGLLSDSRSGISFSEDELRHIDEIVTPLIQQGQSLSCVNTTIPNPLPISSMPSIYVSEGIIYRIRF